MLSMYVSAAVFAQAAGLGKREKKASKGVKNLDKEQEKLMSEEAKKAEEEQQQNAEDRPRAVEVPAEPEPTEAGPEVMGRREKELRKIALDARAGRIAALQAEAEKEEKKRSEAEKEKPTNPVGASTGVEDRKIESEEKEEESSEDSSDSTSEEEKPTNPVEPRTSNLDEATQCDEDITDEQHEEAAQEFNDTFKETMRPYTEKV